MAITKLSSGSIEIVRVSNGVMIRPAAFNERAGTIQSLHETMVFEDQARFEAFIGDWWETTELKR